MSVAAPKRNVSERFRKLKLSETFLKSEAQSNAGVTLCFTFLRACTFAMKKTGLPRKFDVLNRGDNK
jgi:hypothetical protein